MPHPARLLRLLLLVSGCLLGLSATAQEVSVTAADDTAPAPPTPGYSLPLDPGFPLIVAPSIPSATDAVPPALSLGSPSTPRRPLHLNLSLSAGYDDNINNTADAQGSAFFGANLSGNYTLATPRTTAALQVGGGVTYYVDRPGQSGADYNASLGLTLTHRFTPRLSVSSSVLLTYQPEPNFALNTGINRRTGSDYLYANVALSATYLWTPRFSTVAHYTFNDIQSIGGSSAVPNLPGILSAPTQDRIENTVGAEFRYLILPTVTGVAEYRLQFTTYQTGNFDSITHFGLLGVNQTIGPRLSYSLRGGAQYRTSDQSDSISPYFEGSVSYVLTRSSLLSWVNQYGIQEGALAGQGRRTNYHTGINLSYRWTARISSQLGFYYDHNEQSGNNGAVANSLGSGDDDLNLNLSTRYVINRFASVEAGYSFTDLMSQQDLASYTRNRVHLGVNLGF